MGTIHSGDATAAQNGAMTTTPTRDLDVLDPALYMGDPSPTFAWLRHNEPVYWDAHNGLFAITRHADIVAIERNPAVWSSQPGTRPLMNGEITTESMIDLDNPHHAEQRSIVGDQFTRKAVNELESKVRATVDALIDKFATRGHADLVAELAAPLPVAIICEKLGFEEAMWPTLQVWGDMVNNLGDGVRFQTPEKIGALMEWLAYSEGVMTDKTSHPCGDLLSKLTTARLDAYSGCPMPMKAQLDEALLLLVGGSDTTRASISTAMWELTRHRDQFDALRADPTKLAVAVEEFVRWATPVMNMCRTATTDTTMHGVEIKAGQKVLLMYGAANRDETVFGETAEMFDTTRSPNPHVGFGFGPHLCLGINLARMEIRVCIEQLLRRLPDIRVQSGFTPSYNETAFVRGYVEMPVTFTPVNAN